MSDQTKLRQRIVKQVVRELLKEHEDALPSAPADVRQTWEQHLAITAAGAGAVSGAAVGSQIGFVGGPLGGIAGTVPGAIVGAVAGYLVGGKAGSRFHRRLDEPAPPSTDHGDPA